ncbi:MAG: aminomethyl-transferring glycine dehydrogenase [Streptosporangiales bacterium]
MADRPSIADLHAAVPFADRHIGLDADAEATMLDAAGYATVDELLAAALPADIRTRIGLDLPPAASEAEALAELRALADRNQVHTSMIGQGYHDTVTPPVIRRAVLENPAWYTAYTPYQPEISQGRLEALLNFQTMVADLTGLSTANASLLDEPTAAAEAMTLARRTSRGGGGFLVDADCLPQTLEVLRTRAAASGIELTVTDLSADTLPEGDYFGMLLQYPGSSGAVRDLAPLIGQAHENNVLVAVAADLLALTLLQPPAEAGADIAVGSAQRFGVPMGYGGPHAGYIAVRERLRRSLPGRLVGVSVDADGKPAYRLALQTREQHIRREKATSNICTAQVLLAVMAGMYAVYHGADGLRRIAWRVHRYAAVLAAGLRAGDVEVVHEGVFDTVLARVPGRAAEVVAAACERGFNLRQVDADHVGISCDEVTVAWHVEAVWAAFGVRGQTVDALDPSTEDALPRGLVRTSDFLTHPVFGTHRSETAMLRYLRRLSDEDYALDRGMIPLGSCTMKLNAAAEMEPITWPGWANIHPYAPADQTAGYAELIEQLSGWLAEVTGYDSVTLQPNAGSQGELTGLLAIRAYHEANGDEQRDVCLIPSSAHGTNAASAVLSGLRVVVVGCDASGNVDLDDLAAKLEQHADRVAAIMITYPSTHGVYEQEVQRLCEMVHEAGGQVYVDGANLNALLGIAKPGLFGGDVSHLNLHKTFCIPHGGGGPGVGPVAARAHLAPYLPGGASSVGQVAGAPYGSAGILPISWAYIKMMGADGLTRATKAAVLAANYVAARLAPHYPVLYTGPSGLVAHECIVDLRALTKESGVTVEDVAKRLIDYGFHAPTMSVPVPGTFMVEPTESEDLAELDRFCDAMIAIRAEMDKVSKGEWPADDNPLRNAPHTAAALTGEWEHPYSRVEAVYPRPGTEAAKYWPPVRRIDQAYGDRNLVCACPPLEAFES